MAIRNLTNWNDPLFRKKSKEVINFNERLCMLLDDMKDTLEKAKGYGCAAVHIGVLRRVIIVLDKTGLIEIVNPVVVEESKQTQVVTEGSIAPGSPRGKVTRPKSVVVSGFDRNGKEITVRGEGFLCATLLHEIDHLDGLLFADKIK